MAVSAATSRALLLSLPPIALALWTFVHVNTAVGPWLNPIVAKCIEDSSSVGNPISRTIQICNCFMVPFFSEIVAREEGVFIFGNLISLYAAFGALQSVESSRFGTRAPLSAQAAYCLIFVFVAVSVGVPLFWLPSYFLMGLPFKLTQGVDISTVGNPKTKEFLESALGERVDVLKLKVSQERVWALALANTCYFVIGVLCLVPWAEPKTLVTAIKFELWFPIVSPCLWLLVPVSAHSDTQKGKQAVKDMHCFTAGLGVASHVALVALVLLKPSIVTNIFHLVYSHEGPVSCVYFLLVDLIVFWVAMAYHVFVEGGALAAALVVAATPFLGTGAPFCFYYMHRESQIFSDLAKVADADSASKKGD